MSRKGRLTVRKSCSGKITRIITLFVLCTTVSPSFGFSILSTEALRDSDSMVTVVVDSRIEFSEDVVEALNSSIPITVQTTIKIYQVRNNFWDKNIYEYVTRDVLSYRSLYRDYLLKSADRNVNGGYTSLEAMLEALGRQRTYQVELAEDTLLSDRSYVGRVRISIDRSALPSVMRLPVFFNDAWRLKSERVKFDVK